MDELLALEPVPTLSAIRETFSTDDIRAAVARVEDAAHRIALAQAWWPWAGLRPAVLVDANAGLTRILHPSLEKHLSPYKSPAGKRTRKQRRPDVAGASEVGRAAEFDEPEEHPETQDKRQDGAATQESRPFKDILLSLEASDKDPPPCLGFETAQDLQRSLAHASAAELQRAAALLGLSQKGSKMQLGMDIWHACMQEADDVPRASRASSDGRHRPPSGSQQSQDFSMRLRQEQSDDSEEWDSTDDEDEVVGSQQGGRASAWPAQHAWRSPGPAPLDLKVAFARLNGDDRLEDAQATLDVLREAAQQPRVRAGVQRLFAAASQHLLAAEFPRKMTHKAGTYYGEHRAVNLVGAPAEWVNDELSENLRRDATLPADDVALRWVEDIYVEEVHTAAPQPGRSRKPPQLRLGMLLSADVTADMALSSGSYGWAEAASAAAGVAAREMWEPLLQWKPATARYDPQVKDTLWRKLGQVLSRATGAVSVCNEKGLRRVIAAALAMTYAVATLAEAATTCDDAVWRKLLELWLQDLQDKALLGGFRLSAHRTTALISSPDPAPARAARPSLEDRPQGRATTEERRETPLRKVAAAHGGDSKNGRRFDDEPDTFVWCSICHTHKHCLWACPLSVRDIQRRVKQGASTQAAADAIIARTRRKYEQKGHQFVSALDRRPGRTRADLLRSLVA